MTKTPLTTQTEKLQAEFDAASEAANDPDIAEEERLRASIRALKAELRIIELDGGRGDWLRESISLRENLLTHYEAALQKAETAARLAFREAYAAEMTNAFMGLPTQVKEELLVSLGDGVEWDFNSGY